MKRLLIIWMLLITALFAVGCDDPPPWTETPAGFVEVGSHRFVFKAVSPEGATIGIRRRVNDERGDLKFWLAVFQREMVEGKGYRLVDTSNIKSNDGVEGRLMRFEIADQQVPYSYRLALFITPKSIVTIEAACELAQADKHGAAFLAAVQKANVTRDDDAE